MSTLKTVNVQVGQSATATNNFTLYQPASPDGTVRLGVGNSGATTADAITVTNAGNATLLGNLTVSGTGTSAFGGTVTQGGVASERIVRGTAQTTSGANTYGFTGIPSWAQRLTLVFSGVLNTGGTFINLGSGSYASSGYSTFETRTASNAVSTFASTVNNGWAVGASTALSGSVVFTLVNSATNAWAISGGFYSSSASTMYTYGGFIALTGALDRVQIYGGSGLTNFTGGSVNIIYEG
jgi:hypothetical protein